MATLSKQLYYYLLLLAEASTEKVSCWKLEDLTSRILSWVRQLRKSLLSLTRLQVDKVLGQAVEFYENDFQNMSKLHTRGLAADAETAIKQNDLENLHLDLEAELLKKLWFNPSLPLEIRAYMVVMRDSGVAIENGTAVELGIGDGVYNYQKVESIQKDILDYSLKKLTSNYKEYKWIVNCNLMKRTNDKQHISSSTLWNPETDGMTKYEHSTPSQDIVVTAYWFHYA